MHQGAVAQMVERSLSMREVAGSIPASSIRFAIMCSRVNNLKQDLVVTAVGFEPTPLRTAALTQRLRPLGHAVHTFRPDTSDDSASLNVLAACAFHKQRA